MYAVARSEAWGHVAYERTTDEFHAITNGPARSIILSRPISAGCLITPRCNLRCGFCYGNLEQLPRDELSPRKWSELFIHMSQEWGLMRVDLSGGEPTLRQDCTEIATAALDAGLQVVLSTNGLVWHQHGPKNLPRSIGLHISMDSGFEEVHERSRLLPMLRPSTKSFEKVSAFICHALDYGHRVRVLTCIGQHNADSLFALAEHIAKIGVLEWNISRILRAGRALGDFSTDWDVDGDALRAQIETIREAFPWITIRYSNRVDQNGYFLLVLPNGMAATQYTDERNKVALGDVMSLTLRDLQTSSVFDLVQHCRKWIAAVLDPQPMLN
jgi:MoaA/NifB/PqqE/SkfB family radical SAM enzyme